MNNDLIEAFVTKADGDVVRVNAIDKSCKEQLSKLGFAFDEEFKEYTLQVSGNRGKADLFDKIRALGWGFSSGREWCPAEVFRYLRDSGFISGAFKMISWTGPGDYTVTVL